MKAPRYRVYRTSQLNAAREGWTACCEAWGLAWGVHVAEVGVHPVGVDAEPWIGGTEGVSTTGTVGKAWLSDAHPLSQACAHALFQGPASTISDGAGPESIAKLIADQAAKALLDAVARMTGEDNDLHWIRTNLPPREQFPRGCGALLLRVKVGEAGLAFLLDAQAARQVVGMSAAPEGAPASHGLAAVRTAAAAGASAVVLDVLLGQAEIDLSALLTLRAGDIVRLNRRVDQPASVVMRDGYPVADAHLGSAGRRMAVELVGGAPQRRPLKDTLNPKGPR